MGAKHKTISIFVNQVEYRTAKQEMTSAEIRALATVPLDFELFEVRGDFTVSVGIQRVVQLHDRSSFRALPGPTSQSWRLFRPQ